MNGKTARRLPQLFISATCLALTVAATAGSESPGLTARTALAPGIRLGATADRSWISNLSVLASLTSAGDSYTLGYVVGGGTGDKQLLIRAAGPSLLSYGVAAALPDPKLELFSGSQKTGENDNWSGSASVASAMSAVGAFPFADTRSLDAALLTTISGGANSVRVSAADARTGDALGEIYDTTPAADFTATTPRLANVSVLKRIDRSLTVGFVIAGESPKTVLVRAVGPTLAAAPYNVAGGLPNPRLTLYGAGQKRIDENDDWGGAPALAAAFDATGAFGLPAHSRDAALVAELAPGSYTVVVNDAGGGAGLALVEVYEVNQPVAADPNARPFTIAVLPDTQYYTKPTIDRGGELAMFTAQTDWIQAHHDTENIVYVAHVGDISDDGDVGGSVPAATQWANAVKAMSRLESPSSIPYGMAVGNHDEEPNGDPDGTTTRFNENFGVSRFAGRPYYGGHYGTNNDNHYDLFTAAGRGYLAVYVKYDAANAHPELTAWADEVVRTHPDRQAILVTHNMAAAGHDYMPLNPQGGRLYNALKDNPNFFLALGGHVGGRMSFRRDPSGPYNRQKVTTLVADYQFDARGGAGFLRLYRYAPDYGYMTCRTYSPFLGEYDTGYGNDFTQSLAPRGPAEEAVVALSGDKLAVVSVLSKVGARDTPGRSTVGVAFQTAAKSNQWSNWTTLDGPSGFRHLHALALPDDRLAVLAIGPASDAWVRFQNSPGAAGAWSAWSQIPGTPLQADGSKALSYLKAVRLTDERLAVVGWTDGDAAYVSQQVSVGGAFSAWASIGGSGFRQGDLVRLADNRLIAISVADGGSVQASAQEAPGGAWSPWMTISGGGKLFSYVSAVAKPDDTVVIFATRPEVPSQAVYTTTSGAGGATWGALASLGNTGGNGLARVQAVLRSDGRIALFGCLEHGVARHALQSTPGGDFSGWQTLTSPTAYEIGSVKGVVLSDNSLAAVSHGAATIEHFAYQPTADGTWVVSGGLPVVWTR